MKRIIRLMAGWITGLCLFSCTGHFDRYNSDNTGFTDEQSAYDYNTFGVWLKVIQMGIYFNYDWGGGKNWPFQTIQNLNADMFCGYMHDYMENPLKLVPFIHSNLTPVKFFHSSILIILVFFLFFLSVIPGSTLNFVYKYNDSFLLLHLRSDSPKSSMRIA